MNPVAAALTPPYVESEAAPIRSRERIMDVAEVLFSQHGFEATSTRSIAVKADVKLGMVHYHFASKRQLFVEVFMRRGQPLAVERLRLLQEARKQWPNSPIPLAELIKGLLSPLVQMASRPEGAAFVSLNARLTSEPPELALEVRNRLHNEVTPHFVAAFREALPHLPEEVLYWRVYLMLGANNAAMLKSERLSFISGGKCDSDDLQMAMKQMIPFIEAGLRAPL
ncbi:MAG: TetR/AcrR family transcriptional regulator, partial [Alcaligenaceae bacterium]